MLAFSSYFDCEMVGRLLAPVVAVSVGLHSFNSDLRAQEQSPNTDIIPVGSTISPEKYLLGPGDVVRIDFLTAPELTGDFLIGPDGNISLPRLGSLNASRQSPTELSKYLSDRYSDFLRDPKISISLAKYRPIKVYVQGAVQNPGYHTLSAYNNDGTVSFPTVFDTIKVSNGPTPLADLTKVQLTRELGAADRYSHITATIDFANFLESGNPRRNPRVFDGDRLTVTKASSNITNVVELAAKTNITPITMKVYVGGRVSNPGIVEVPYISSLRDAIDLVGGRRPLSGQVAIKRIIDTKVVLLRVKYRPDSEFGSSENPRLYPGDSILVGDTILSSSLDVFGNVLAPAAGAIGIFSILN